VLTLEPTADEAIESAPLPGRWASAASGLLAGAAALATGELFGGFLAKWQSPVVSVAEAVIDSVPRPVKDFAIETFGEDDKIALVVGILAFSIVFSAVLGLVGRRRPPIAAAGFGVFALVGVWASQRFPGSPLSAVIPSLMAGVAGAATFLVLHRMAARPQPSVAAADQPQSGLSTRRRFLIVSGSVAAFAAVATTAGRALRGRFSAASSRNAVVLPTPAESLATAPASVAVDAPGVSPFYTPNSEFYRVDTALEVPQVPTEGWTL
jgi:hypothetical protein